MNLPPALDTAIHQGLASIENDSRHHLDLNYRQTIWAALGQVMDRSLPYGGQGHYRRAMLDLLTVRHVQPVWDAVWPDNDSPQQVLADAEQALAGKLGAEDAVTSQIRWLWTEFDDFILEDEDQHSTQALVLFAAVKTLCRAYNDLEFDPTQLDPAAKDGRLAPRSTDAAFDASVAASEGLPWQQSSHPALRKAFWDWWLTEAVPAAYAATPPEVR